MSDNATATGPPMPPPLPPDAPHDTKQPDIMVASVLIWVIAAAFVAARFYTRSAIQRVGLGSSEWFLFSSVLCSLAVSICSIMEAYYGMGAHIYDLTPTNSNIPAAIKSQWVAILFYCMSLLFTKISILILYLVIFEHSWVRPAAWTMIAITSIAHIWVFYVIFTACTPLQAFWDFTVLNAQCHPQSFWLGNQYIMIITDFFAFLLPIPVLWQLKVRARQKALLLFLFALGFFVCLISIIRLVLLTPIVMDTAPKDPSYAPTFIYYWTLVETNTAIIVASAMTLKPFLNRFMPKLLTPHPYRKESDNISPPDPSQTFGSTPSRKKELEENHIRIESSFTADFDGKADVEMGQLNEQGRRMRMSIPFASPETEEKTNADVVVKG